MNPRALGFVLHLYEIGAILSGFVSVERTFPAIVTVLSRALPLRTVICLGRSGGESCAFSWWAADSSPSAYAEAEAHARRTYAYLTGSVGEEPPDLDARGPPEPAAVEATPEASGTKRFIALPLVVTRGAVFATLQLEAAARLDEQDLAFMSAVAHQIALALHRKDLEATLLRAQAMFAGVVSIATDAVLSVDEEQRITIFNDVAVKIFGYSREEALGAPLSLLLDAAARDRLQEFAGGPGSERLELAGRRKDGEEILVEGTLSRLAIDGRRGLTLILRDVTERKRLAQGQQILAEAGMVLASSLDHRETLAALARLMTSSIADACVVDLFGEDGRVEWSTSSIGPPDKADLAGALVQAPPPGAPAAHARSALRTGAAELWSDLSPGALELLAPHPERLRALRLLEPTSSIAVPILAQRRVVGALVLLSTEPRRRYGVDDLLLAKEIAARAALAIENARLYEEARRAVRVREDLLAAVSHDLRTPLSNIVVNTALLLESPERDDTARRKRLERIQRAAERMDRLLYDLLDAAAIEAGTFSVERRRLAVAPLISHVLDAAEPQAAQRGSSVQSDLAPDLPDVLGDASRLEQVMDNLLGNALKLTPAGGSITVRAERSGGALLVSVRDTGPGIAETEIPHLFERFWQARPTDRRGIGLGLFIVKRIIDAHAGRVWVESILGKGSTFFFTVPLADSPIGL